MKDIFKCLMIIIGALIGAGFASGKEIASFFNYYLNNGKYGIIIASLLYGVLVFFILTINCKNKTKSYQEIVKNSGIILLGEKIFLFICFCIMIAAVGSFVKEVYSISLWIRCCCL